MVKKQRRHLTIASIYNLLMDLGFFIVVNFNVFNSLQTDDVDES